MKTRSPSGHVCGQSHYNAKLSDAVVREMRLTWQRWKAEGSYKGYASLGDAFGISGWTARDIVTYRTRANA